MAGLDTTSPVRGGILDSAAAHMDVRGDESKPLSALDLNIVDALVDNGYYQYFPAAVGVLVLSIVGVVLAPFSVLVSTIAAVGVAGAIFLTARHAYLSRERARNQGSIWSATTSSESPATEQLPAVYYTYILGSGGHTGEMFEFAKRSYKGHANLHRRYIITSGDAHSPNIVARLETLIRDTASGRPTGTWDVVRVARARRVHQPLWSAWYTSLLSALSIVNALVREPRERAREENHPPAGFRYPHVIVTNGPGTGFVVCLVAYVLKLLCVIPADRARVVYMETWAHISTLSLTGNLFYYSDIADVFLVQHEQLAKRTGKPCLRLFKPPIFARKEGSKAS